MYVCKPAIEKFVRKQIYSSIQIHVILNYKFWQDTDARVVHVGCFLFRRHKSTQVNIQVYFNSNLEQKQRVSIKFYLIIKLKAMYQVMSTVSPKRKEQSLLHAYIIHIYKKKSMITFDKCNSINVFLVDLLLPKPWPRWPRELPN